MKAKTSKDPKKTKKNPKGKEVTKLLPFKLTDEEKAVRGLEAAEKQSEIAQFEYEKKKASDEIGAKIKSATARRNVLLSQIRTGEESREVKCIEVKNFETNKVEYYFEGEKNSERDMTDHDRQLEMNTDPKKTKSKKTAKGSTESSAKQEMTAQDRDIAETHREETSARGSWSMVNGARQ